MLPLVSAVALPGRGPVSMPASMSRHFLLQDSQNPFGADTSDPFIRRDVPSPLQAGGWMALGLVASLLLGVLFRGRGATAAAKKSLPYARDILNNPAERKKEWWVSLNDAVSALVGLAFEDPKLGKNLLAYLATGVAGYLGGSVLQGVQETWVRREETKIRSRLLTRLNDVFRQSIRQKNAMDNTLKQSARQSIGSMLLSWGYSLPVVRYIVSPPDRPDNEAAQTDIHRRYFYQPTHRYEPADQNWVSISFGSTLGGTFNSKGLQSRPSSPNIPYLQAFMNPVVDQRETPWRMLIRTSLVGLGMLAGGLVQLSAWLVRQGAHSEAGLQKLKKTYQPATLTKAINVQGMEALFLLSDKRILLAFLLLSAAGRAGKIVLDGLRQIEVTRVNAETEYFYQQFNWMSLDPSFHGIAESEALENELKQLRADFPEIAGNVPAIKRRVARALDKVGLNSAPKYFLMTPPVGLVDARG